MPLTDPQLLPWLFGVAAAGALLAGLVAWALAASRLGMLRRRAQAAEAALAASGEREAEFRDRIESLNTEAAELRTRLAERANQHERELAQLREAESRLSQTFKTVAGEIFETKQKHFTELSQKQLEGLLNPLNTQLKDFGRLVHDVRGEEKARQATLQAELKQLRELNQQLGKEAHQLVDALKSDVKTMGSWGEWQLERMLNLAGLRKDREYSLQPSFTDREGKRFRPDAVIWLPEDQALVIDAKVSLEHYRRHFAAGEADEKDAALRQHIESIRTHIRDLGGKAYQSLPELAGPDFVFMFIPSEPAFLDALHADATLFDHAQNHGVVLLGPANLLASLRTVASVWHAWRRNENAMEIADRAGLLYDKFCGFVDNMCEVGNRLDQASEAHRQAFGQLSIGHGNLVGQVEKLRQLGANARKRLDSRLAEEALEDSGGSEDSPERLEESGAGDDPD